ALITIVSYPNVADPQGASLLLQGSLLPRLADAALSALGWTPVINAAVGKYPFALTLWLIALLLAWLIYWALLRSKANDPTRSWPREAFVVVPAALLFLVLVYAIPRLVALAIRLYIGEPVPALGVPSLANLGGFFAPHPIAYFLFVVAGVVIYFYGYGKYGNN